MAMGQEPGVLPDVSREFLERRRTLEGDVLRFCVYERSVTANLDREIAHAIADALLVRAEVVDVGSAIDVDGIGFIPLSEEQLFIHLSNDCDAFTGFTLAPNVYPEWLTFSRSYVVTEFAALARPDGPDGLRDLVPGSLIATTMLSEADVHLISYLDTLPNARQWKRYPYPHALLAIERVVDGTADVALVWRPALDFALERVPGATELNAVDPSPLRLPERSLAMAMRTDATYIRTLIDDAIRSLAEAGVITSVLEKIGFAGRSP